MCTVRFGLFRRTVSAEEQRGDRRTRTSRLHVKAAGPLSARNLCNSVTRRMAV